MTRVRDLAIERAGQKRRHQRLRNEALAAYGGRCECCGETEPIFLAIHHKDGGGNQHRREIGGSARTRIYSWLRDNNYPPELGILCHNCNYAEHFGEHGCPHKGGKPT